MNSFTRSAAAILVGGSLVLGAGVACSTPHTIDGYISEIRGQMDEWQSRTTSDDQIVNIGRSLCSVPEALDTSRIAESDATPAQQDATVRYSETTTRYCDVLGTEPAFAAPAGAGGPAYDPGPSTAPAALPPTPITVGEPVKINYGGQDVLTTTVNRVFRCENYLAIDATVVTGDTYSSSDGIFMAADYLGTDGVTRPITETYAYPGCGEELPYSMDRKPGRTYQGVFYYDIRQGSGAELAFTGSDGITRTLDITGL